MGLSGSNFPLNQSIDDVDWCIGDVFAFFPLNMYIPSGKLT